MNLSKGIGNKDVGILLLFLILTLLSACSSVNNSIANNDATVELTVANITENVVLETEKNAVDETIPEVASKRTLEGLVNIPEVIPEFLTDISEEVYFENLTLWEYATAGPVQNYGGFSGNVCELLYEGELYQAIYSDDGIVIIDTTEGVVICYKGEKLFIPEKYFYFGEKVLVHLIDFENDGRKELHIYDTFREGDSFNQWSYVIRLEPFELVDVKYSEDDIISGLEFEIVKTEQLDDGAVKAYFCISNDYGEKIEGDISLGLEDVTTPLIIEPKVYNVEYINYKRFKGNSELAVYAKDDLERANKLGEINFYISIKYDETRGAYYPENKAVQFSWTDAKGELQTVEMEKVISTKNYTETETSFKETVVETTVVVLADVEIPDYFLDTEHHYNDKANGKEFLYEYNPEYENWDVTYVYEDIALHDKYDGEKMVFSLEYDDRSIELPWKILPKQLGYSDFDIYKQDINSDGHEDLVVMFSLEYSRVHYIFDLHNWKDLSVFGAALYQSGSGYKWYRPYINSQYVPEIVEAVNTELTALGRELSCMQIINPGEIRWLENETEQVYSSITEDGNLIIQITNFMGFTIWTYELTLTYTTDKWQIEDINLIYSDWDFYDKFYAR